MKPGRIPYRLARIAAYLPEGAFFADIGSDHAYLPCYVCRRDDSARAIASDVNEGPFQRTENAIQTAGLNDRIDARLGNGLQTLAHQEVQQIVISGMGGILICKILQAGQDKLHKVSRLIIQPNSDERYVRKYLMRQPFVITHEELVDENGHIYEILVADKATHPKALTEKELLFGPIMLQCPSELFYKKWRAAYKKRQEILQKMKNVNHTDQTSIEHYMKELAWIKELLNDEKTGSGG